MTTRISLRSRAALLVTGLALSGCGTTYALPETSGEADATAAKLFADARAEPARTKTTVSAAEARFARVAGRVGPTARKLCEAELDADKAKDCAVRIEIDRKMAERNAYFTYVDQKPTIRFSVPLLQDTQNDDEVAFVMGHEYGHLIGQHIQKQQQQAVTGALIMGVLTAAASANAASSGAYYNHNAVSQNMELGAAVGGRAYSQTYELESDMLGARIASSAGYDPVKGAKFFARDEAARSETGKLSFWGTHPADKDRLAVVIATQGQIDAKQALTRKSPAN